MNKLTTLVIFGFIVTNGYCVENYDYSINDNFSFSSIDSPSNKSKGDNKHNKTKRSKHGTKYYKYKQDNKNKLRNNISMYNADKYEDNDYESEDVVSSSNDNSENINFSSKDSLYDINSRNNKTRSTHWTKYYKFGEDTKKTYNSMTYNNTNYQSPDDDDMDGMQNPIFKIMKEQEKNNNIIKNNARHNRSNSQEYNIKTNIYNNNGKNDATKLSKAERDMRNPMMHNNVQEDITMKDRSYSMPHSSNLFKTHDNYTFNNEAIL
ncbi:MAG: hypothetical protein IJU54_01030 [Alphaproteobacteria bacterium]|nr:hypothetical protein [Alphaproteobacteria bacterium]